MPSIAGAGLGVPTTALHGSGFHPGYVHCRSHPCSLFLPIRSAFAPLRVLHCQKIKFPLKQKRYLFKKQMPSIAGAGLGVPTSALHGSGFHPGYVHCRSHPCSLFLPIRSAFTPLRALHCQKIKFSLKQKKAPVKKQMPSIAGAGLEPAASGL